MTAGPLLLIGNLPPPVHGQSVVTAQMLERFLEHGFEVQPLDLAAKPVRDPRLAKLLHAPQRVGRMLWALLAVTLARLRGRPPVYLVADAGEGMVFTLAVVLLLRLLGLRCWIHHHSYAYLRAPTRLSRWLFAAGEDVATHICLAPMMERQMIACYGPATATLSLENFPFVQAPALLPEGARGRPLTIGHLSNLTLAKGVAEVLAVHARLRERGIPADLVLAGPFHDPEAEKLVRAAMAKGEGVRHLGPVHGAAKADFLAGIDVFLFPSRYANEAAPLVMIEALAAGVPSIAISIGAIADLVGAEALLLDPKDAELVGHATEALERLAHDRHELAARSRTARQTFDAGLARSLV